jgi:hypothetical protein
MHVFQSYIETILKSTNPLKFITENCINFHLFILSKIKPSASCLNKKYASQALCILQYIFKLENVSMRIKDQVTMTLIHVFWIKWTTLFMQAHLIFKWSIIWCIEICMSSTCFYFCLQYECCSLKHAYSTRNYIYKCKYLT